MVLVGIYEFLHDAFWLFLCIFMHSICVKPSQLQIVDFELE